MLLWAQRRFRRVQKLIGPATQSILDSRLFRLRGLNRLILAVYCRYKSLEATPIEQIREFVIEGSIVIDVGAHFGFFTTQFSRLVGTNGMVIAIEPNKSSLGMLAHHLSTRRMTNIQVFSCAAWSSTTRVHLVMDGPLGVTSHIATTPGHQTTTIEGRSIDDIMSVPRPARVSFIKIDVEGAELEVLRGALATLQTDKPTVLCEIGSEYGLDSSRHLSEFFRLLRSINYECCDVKTKLLLSEEEITAALADLRYLDVLLCPSKTIGMTN